MNDIPLKENIKNISLSAILSFLSRNRKTGTLIVKTPVFTKKTYLLKGDAIFASSTYEDDRLGEMLLKAGKITMEQYDTAVQILKKTNKRLGAILVELGYLTPKDLFWGVKYQVKEIIYSLFLLEDADFEFIEGETPPNEVITLKMSMGNLIYEGVQRIDNWTRIRKEMPPADTILKLSTDPVTLFQDVELSPRDRKMLSVIDGVKTVKEIVDSAWIGSFEGMKILYLLWSIGVVEEKKKVSEKTEFEESISLDDILQPVSEDEYAFLGKVDELYVNLGSFNDYQLLEIDKDADEDTIKKSYYRLTREFHPDRSFGAPDPMLKDRLTKIFDALTDAYNYLQRRIKEAPKKERGTPALSATEHFRNGIEGFKKSDFPAAAISFSSAAGMDPKNAKYWSYLALSLTKVPDRIQDAESALLKAVSLEPGNADHYANLGMICVMQGNKKAARERFQKALSLDPGNNKAAKGLEKLK